MRTARSLMRSAKRRTSSALAVDGSMSSPLLLRGAQSGDPGLLCEQRQEILVPQADADGRLDQLVDGGADRQRHLQRACRREAQVEVLAEQFGGERRGPVEGDQVLGPVPDPLRTKHG